MPRRKPKEAEERGSWDLRGFYAKLKEALVSAAKDKEAAQRFIGKIESLGESLPKFEPSIFLQALRTPLIILPWLASELKKESLPGMGVYDWKRGKLVKMRWREGEWVFPTGGAPKKKYRNLFIVAGTDYLRKVGLFEREALKVIQEAIDIFWGEKIKLGEELEDEALARKDSPSPDPRDRDSLRVIYYREAPRIRPKYRLEPPRRK